MINAISGFFFNLLINLYWKLGVPTVKNPAAGAYTVRTNQTGDKVYMIKDGKRHWIKNLVTLEKLGFRIGDEKSIESTELFAFGDGDPMDFIGAKPPTKSTDQTKEFVGPDAKELPEGDTGFGYRTQV